MTSGDLTALTRAGVKTRGAPSATTGVDGQGRGIQRIKVTVSGLTCANCVQAVERDVIGMVEEAR
jgi:hypothetical protein